MSIENDLNTMPTVVPKEWQPYSEQVGQVGKAVVHLPRPGATEYDLLIGAGFDPDNWKISGPIKTRKWMRYDQEWLYWYAFEVAEGESEQILQAHIDDLTKWIRRRKPATRIAPTDGDAWIFLASDLQIGKAEGGIGTDQTVDRFIETVDMAAARIKELRRIGRKMPHGALIGLGDMVEGCQGNYPGQPFLVDRNRRDQNKIGRELITYALDTLSPNFAEFTVASVGGNHGEHRNDGVKATDDADNDDVACFEAVKETFDRAGQDFHWILPQLEMSIALELGGIKVGATHGHIFRKGATPQQKALEWFKGQDFGFQQVRDATILFSAHFHHFLGTQAGRRWLMQTPAMDPGSGWHVNATGEESLPGVLTMRLDAGQVNGFADLQILSPTL